VSSPRWPGELTQHLPFEIVDEALAATRTTQSRLRDLPSRIVVYLLLAACLFPEVGYSGVWRKLTAALGDMPTATPTPRGLATARQRITAAPLRWLFDLLRGPAATGRAPGTRWRGLLVCAIDGTILTVSDTPATLTAFTKHRGNHGGTGYPQIRLVALLACGTRTLLDAVFGPTTSGETTYTQALLPSLRPGMILLADRNFAAQDLLAQIAATGAHVLVRLKNGRKTPILARYPDGSYLSMLGRLRVRVIDCEITICTPAGRQTGLYRLATTLLDPHRYPAAELITLYHRRWEIETAYLELKSSMLGGRVLRARTPTGVVQEIYALLVVYQTPAHRHGRCHQHPTEHRSGPGQLQHRLASRPRPDHPSRKRDRRHRHRPGRHHRPPRPGRPATRSTTAGLSPHRQTRHLQIPGTRPQHRPHQLQSHPRHRHPRPTRTLTTPTKT
jgi:hypothetical protein